MFPSVLLLLERHFPPPGHLPEPNCPQSQCTQAEPSGEARYDKVCGFDIWYGPTNTTHTCKVSQYSYWRSFHKPQNSVKQRYAIPREWIGILGDANLWFISCNKGAIKNKEGLNTVIMIWKPPSRRTNVLKIFWTTSLDFQAARNVMLTWV